jgi:hypothetical protein
MPISPIHRLARLVDHRLKQAGTRSPGIRRLVRLLGTIHYTSLKTEEGRPLQLRIALVDPSNPDPDRPLLVLPDRWTITKLQPRVPLNVPSLTKLSKAADPWSSTLAVYYDRNNEFFVWGMIDQTVHFNIMLVQETEWGGFAPAGTFHVAVNGTADLSVYREFDFIARLQQDQLLTRQSDVFRSGPVYDRLSDGIAAYYAAVNQKVINSAEKEAPKTEDYLRWVAETWIRTLCRLLISIQRYRHGGAFLVATTDHDLNIKYKLNYHRLPRTLIDFATHTIKMDSAGERVSKWLDDDAESIPGELYFQESISDGDARSCERAITGSVRFISSLSCVDGLILASPDLTVHGFGAEIRTKKEPHPVLLSTTAKAQERALRQVDPAHYGTRHRSMMRYCFAHPKSIGFVVSQDGEIRSMTRVGSRLIIWENLKVLSYLETTIRKHRKNKKQKRPAQPVM